MIYAIFALSLANALTWVGVYLLYLLACNNSTETGRLWDVLSRRVAFLEMHVAQLLRDKTARKRSRK